MPRHSKIYNALFDFYRNSIDKLSVELENSHSKRITKNDEFEATRLSFVDEICSVIRLAKNQAIHFNKESALISDWEKDFIITETISYGDKAVRKMKSKGILTASRKLDDKIWDEIDLFGVIGN